MGIQTKKNNRILKQKQSKLRRHNFTGGSNNKQEETRGGIVRDLGDLTESGVKTVAGVAAAPVKAVATGVGAAANATLGAAGRGISKAITEGTEFVGEKAEEGEKGLEDFTERAGKKLAKAADFAEKISPVKFAKNEIKDAADYLGEKADEVSEKVGKKTSKALDKIESVTSGIGVDRGTIGSLFTSDENCKFDVPSKATGQIENKSESDLKNKLNKNTLFKDDKKFKKFMEDRIINKCREYHDVSKKQPTEYFMRFFNHCSNFFDCFDDLSELVYLFYDVTKTDISFLSQVKEEKNEKNRKQEIDTKVEIKKKELDEYTKEQEEKLEQEKQIGESEEDTKKRREAEKKKKAAMDKIIKEKQKKLEGIENSKKDLLKTIVILLKSVEKLANSDKISSFDELKKEDLGLDETKFKEHIENLKGKIEKQTTRLQSGGDTEGSGDDEVANNEENGNENQNKEQSKQKQKENSNSKPSSTPDNSKPNSKKSGKLGEVSNDSKQILLTIANDELSLTEKSLSKVIESYKDNQPKKLEKKLEDEIENKLLKNIKSKIENTLNNIINEYEKAIGNQVNKSYEKLLNFLKFKMEQSKLDKFLIKYSFIYGEEGNIKNDKENNKLTIFIESVEDYLKKDNSETIEKTKKKLEGLLLTDKTIDELKGKKVTSDPTDVKETGKELNKLRKELKEAKKELKELLPKDGDTIGQGSSDEEENKEIEAAKKRVNDLEKQIKEAEKDFSSKSESFDAMGFKRKLEILVFFMNNVFIASVKEYGAMNSSSEFKFKDDLSRELSKIIEFNKYKEQIDKLDKDKDFRDNLFKIGDTNFIDNKMFETVKIEKRSGEEIPAFDMSELYKKLNNKDVRKNIYDYYTTLMQLEIDMESGKVKIDSKFEEDKFGPNMYMYIVLGFLGTALGFELANLQNVRAAMGN